MAPSVGRNAAPSLSLRLNNEPLSIVQGVGKYPDSLSDVRSSNIVSSQHSPPSIEPERGQVSENTSQPSKSESWGVFHVDENSGPTSPMMRAK